MGVGAHISWNLIYLSFQNIENDTVYNKLHSAVTLQEKVGKLLTKGRTLIYLNQLECYSWLISLDNLYRHFEFVHSLNFGNNPYSLCRSLSEFNASPQYKEPAHNWLDLLNPWNVITICQWIEKLIKQKHRCELL